MSLYRSRPRFQGGFFPVLNVRLSGVLLQRERMNIQGPETVFRECLESVRSAATDLLAEREQFDIFINKMLDEMETVRVDLAERERQLAKERIKWRVAAGTSQWANSAVKEVKTAEQSTLQAPGNPIANRRRVSTATG